MGQGEGGYYFYGAGFAGRITLGLFKSLGWLNKVKGFIDSDINKQGKKIEKIEVYSPEVLSDISDNTLIITTSDLYVDEIAQICLKHTGRFLLFNEIKDELFAQYRKRHDKTYGRDMLWVQSELTKFHTKQFLIESIVVSVGQACSLKCRHCGNFAPLSRPESLHYGLNEIEKDLEVFFTSVDYCFVIQIQGGEPFLYKEIDDLIMYLKSVKNLGGICIATNGKHIPTESFWNSAKNANLSIRISNYTGYKTETSELCAKYDVDVTVYDFCTGTGKWIDLGTEKRIYELEAGETLEDRYQNCLFMSCLTLENGIIARCSRAVNASIIQTFNHKKGDVLVVRDKTKIRDEMKKYYDNPKAMNACLYCRGSKGDVVPAAEQL